MTMNEKEAETMGRNSSLDLFDESDEGEIYIDNAAVMSIDYDANELIVYFAGNRNVVMDLDDDFETMLCDKVLSDPNFWANFLSSFSQALKQSGGE